MMNPVIRSDGNPKFAMISIMAGAVVNIIFDPICIFALKWGKAMQSSVLSMIREILFGVGWAVILPIFYGLNGVLYSMPVSDLLAFVIAVVLIRNIYKSLQSNK